MSRGPGRAAGVAEHLPDLAVIDLQIGNMGGMAACLDLRLEDGAGRLAHVPVLMLLDRQADVFLARRSGADGWLVKPLDASAPAQGHDRRHGRRHLGGRDLPSRHRRRRTG